jgi:hypothetical protein
LPEIELPDEAARAFFAALAERRLTTTRCRACGTVAFPPRVWCHSCLSEDLEWIALSGRGTLAAFSTQEQGLRFAAPDVLGLVDLAEGVRLLSRIDASYESLRIGEPVVLGFVEAAPGLVLHQFAPERPGRVS